MKYGYDFKNLYQKIETKECLRRGMEELMKDVENYINDYGDSDIENKFNIFARVLSTRDLITEKFEKVESLDHQIMDFTIDLDDIQITTKKTVNEFFPFLIKIKYTQFTSL